MMLRSYLTEGDDPVGTVMLAHGFGEHHGRYQHFISRLGEAGFDLWSFDFSGHGEAGGKRATVNVGRLIGEHLDAREELLSRARTPQRIFLFGHSMGGLVTLASTLLNPHHLVATAVTGPALRPLSKVPQPIARIGAAVGRLLPSLGTVSIDITRLSHDPQVAEQYRNDPLVHQGKVPLLTGATMMMQGKHVIDNAGILARPVLILHGEDDILANPTGSQEFAAASNGKAEVRIMPEMYHELLNEVEKDDIATQIIDWYRHQ